jgi:ribulose-5-phosphate 4-epimerase/fuculose-1-phosphate aldolase
VTLEELAELAWGTLLLSPERGAIPAAYQEKHYNRKHGPGAYYGPSSGA